MIIFVNGFKREIEGEHAVLSYDKLAQLFRPGWESVEKHGLLTITYHRATSQGSIEPGQSVAVHNGTHFNVAYTNKA